MQRFIFILFLFSAANAMAQSDTSILKVSKPKQMFISPDRQLIIPDTAAPEKWEPLEGKKLMSWLDQGRQYRNTARGKVYKMPIDSMPCLVPDESKVKAIPTIRTAPQSRMPNAFRSKKY